MSNCKRRSAMWTIVAPWNPVIHTQRT